MKIEQIAKAMTFLAVLHFQFSVFCEGAEARSGIRFRMVHDSLIVVSMMANDQDHLTLFWMRRQTPQLSIRKLPAGCLSRRLTAFSWIRHSRR